VSKTDHTAKLRPAARRAIRAALTGSDQCSALGIVARTSTPVLALCRALIEKGVAPATALQAYRGDTLALVVRTIAEARRWK
jgi:hypothetical protein